MNDAPIRFPTESEIPTTMHVDGDRWSMRWLVGGEIRTWPGEGADVLSPVCVAKPDGKLERVVVGRTPKLDREAALEALAAAKRAWDGGRGEWPTMRVARRIGAMERFVAEMVKTREEVVRLLMWEIGKTRKDAETEFDRTVVYVRDTIEALKELDRKSARFVMEEGFLGQIRRSPLGVVLPRRRARQPGVPHQPQQPVPPRPRHLPLQRPQGLRRRHALGQRRAPRLLHPRRRLRVLERREQGPGERHRGGEDVELPLDRLHLLTG